MESFHQMIQDSAHWHNTEPPYCPNKEEIFIYRKMIGTSTPVYLLGMTKQLIDLCDIAIDLNPIDIGKPVIKADWRSMEGFKAGAIIGDGVLNLVGLDFYKKALELSNKFICRVFTEKLSKMKYAQIFPKEFPQHKLIIRTQKNISMVLWEK